MILSPDILHIKIQLDNVFDLSLDNASFDITFRKIYKEMIIGKINDIYLDEEGNYLKKVSQSDDFQHIIPSGGEKAFYISEEKEVFSSGRKHISKDYELKKIRLDGEEVIQYEYSLELNKDNLEMIKFEDYFLYGMFGLYIGSYEKDLWKILKSRMEKRELISFRYDENNRKCVLLPHPDEVVVCYIGEESKFDFVEKQEIEKIVDMEKLEEEELNIEEFW